jgi:hypothetical protein
MKIFLSLSKIILDKGRFTKAVDSKLKEIHKRANKDMIKAVYPKVPVWTGEARGTLVPFARSVGAVIPINPVAVRRGHNATTGANQSTFNIVMKDGKYITQIDIQLLHYNYLESNPGRSPTAPWRSLQAGKKAYKASIDKQLGRKLKNLPRIKDYIVLTRATNG